MTDDTKKEKPGDEVILGKKFAGEKFPTVASAEDHVTQIALDAQYADDPNALDITIYFSNKRITDPVEQAMRLAYTKVRKATTAAFDEIFAKF